MFDTIEKKLKSVAGIFGWLGIIASVISGVTLFFSISFGTGFAVIICGSLAALIVSFFIYGFGELIEKTRANNETLLRIEKELKRIDLSVNPADANKVLSEKSIPASETSPDDETEEFPDSILDSESVSVSAGQRFFYRIFLFFRRFF